MTELIRMANATMHDQTQYVDAYKKLGYEIDPEPWLREVTDAPDAYLLACEVVERARQEGYKHLLVGGRTDLMIYIAIHAPILDIKLYIADTQRIRDEQDRFVFKLRGVTRVYVDHPTWDVGAAIVAGPDTAAMREDYPEKIS